MLTRPQATAGSAPASQDVQRGQFNAPPNTQQPTAQQASANPQGTAQQTATKNPNAFGKRPGKPGEQFPLPLKSPIAFGKRQLPPTSRTQGKVTQPVPYPTTGTPVLDTQNSQIRPPKTAQDLDNIRRDKERDEYLAGIKDKREKEAAAKKATDDVRQSLGATMEESVDDILRLSGLPQKITEQLSKKAIDAAFMAAAGEFLDKGYTQLPPAAAAPPGQTPPSTDGGGGGQASSTGDGSGQASSTGSGRSGQSSSTGGGDTANATVSGDSMSEFRDWLNKNRNNKKVLGKAKEEIEKTLSRYSAAGSASAGTSPADKSASLGLVTTNQTTPKPEAKTGS
jgi:hypothetical protein